MPPFINYWVLILIKVCLPVVMQHNISGEHPPYFHQETFLGVLIVMYETMLGCLCVSVCICSCIWFNTPRRGFNLRITYVIYLVFFTFFPSAPDGTVDLHRSPVFALMNYIVADVLQPRLDSWIDLFLGGGEIALNQTVSLPTLILVCVNIFPAK